MLRLSYVAREYASVFQAYSSNLASPQQTARQGSDLVRAVCFVPRLCIPRLCIPRLCIPCLCVSRLCIPRLFVMFQWDVVFQRLRPCLRAQAARCCSASRCAARIELPSPSSGNKRKQPPTATDRSFGMLVAAGPVRLSKSGGCQCHRETPAPAGRRDNPIRR